MTPIQVRQLFQQHKRLSLKQVMQYFAIEVGIAEQLIAFWVKRGGLVPLAACNGCQLVCATTRVYQWVQ